MNGSPAATTAISPEAFEFDLLDADDACRLLGGSRPINRATLYRGIKLGRFPAPLKVGQSSRWVRRELEDVLQYAMAERDRQAAA